MSNTRSDDTAHLVACFKALANPHRLAMFHRMSRCCPPGTRCTIEDAVRFSVGELGEELEIAPSTLSHHLEKLRQAGLVRAERRGRSVLCWVEPAVLEDVAAFFTPDVEDHPDPRGATMNQPTQTCCEPTCCDEEAPSTAEEATEQDARRGAVREAYAKVARADDDGEPTGEASGCCGVSDDEAINRLVSTRLGYSDQDLERVPEGADMGLGCGNPKAIAALRPGEVVLDLGAGGGFDCFLAAAEVGDTGRVIGVDMTPDMLAKARRNAARGGYDNVEFRLGEIEHLPVPDATADVILSNCVINLSPDKPRVFREAFRALKPGGRLAISDVVATAEIPAEMREDAALVAGCVGGAALMEDLERMIAEAGFQDVRIEPKDASREFIRDWAPGRGVEDYVVSATIEAVRPR